MGSPGKVLLAEDEETFLQSTADLLREEGSHCDGAKDLKTARECLAAQEYDLLISDINIPGNGQFEFLKDVYQQD